MSKKVLIVGVVAGGVSLMFKKQWYVAYHKLKDMLIGKCYNILFNNFKCTKN